jgi:hypothetical protein
VPAAVDLEGRLQLLAQRHRVVHVLEQLHPLVVLDALRLHLRDGLALGLAPLRGQHLPRRLQRRLDDAQDVERVRRRLPVQQLERGDGERRQRLVQREVGLQLDGEPDRAALGVRDGQPLDGAGAQQRLEDADRLAHQPALLDLRGVVLGEQPAHVHEEVARPLHDLQQHRVADPEARGQHLRLGATSRSKVGLPQDTKPSGPSCARPA